LTIKNLSGFIFTPFLISPKGEKLIFRLPPWGKDGIGVFLRKDFAVKWEFLTFRIITFTVGLLLSSPLFSQNESIPENIMSIAEELASDETNPEEASVYIEQLQELSENPVKINSGDGTEISRLFFLSVFQLNALNDYINSTGQIVSVYELANIPGFDRQAAEMIIPFITLEAGQSINRYSSKLRNSVITSMTVKPGEVDTSSSGSPLKILSKYKFNAGRIEGGISVEKDQGEKYFYGYPPVPDFLSAHLSFSGKGIIRRIILGDFGARFGLGTNINTGIHTAPSLTAPGYMSGGEEIKPYTSTDENNFFRGAAAEFAIKKMRLVLFFSSSAIDATVEQSKDSLSSFVSSFYTAGLHNSASLLQKKDAVREISAGINLSYSFTHLKIGTVFSGNRFSLKVNPDTEVPENLYDFSGSKNQNISFYYNSLINRILLYGEISLNPHYEHSLVQGISLRPSDRLSLNILYTDYSPGYLSFHANGPGIGKSGSNETGLLGNFTFEAAKHLFISAGCSFSRFPWLKFRCSFPSFSVRKELKLSYTPGDDLTIDLIYKYRSAMYNSSDGKGIEGISETRTRAIKGAVRYRVNDNLALITRIDYNNVISSRSAGMMLSQDFKLSFGTLPLTLWMRYSLYNTDDWESRVYAYENDLLYSFSIPALAGEGSRSYVMAEWEFGRWSELRIKYAVTSTYSDNEIPAGKDELKVQFRVWF
jgi:hypothetical protein